MRRWFAPSLAFVPTVVAQVVAVSFAAVSAIKRFSPFDCCAICAHRSALVGCYSSRSAVCTLRSPLVDCYAAPTLASPTLAAFVAPTLTELTLAKPTHAAQRMAAASKLVAPMLAAGGCCIDARCTNAHCADTLAPTLPASTLVKLAAPMFAALRSTRRPLLAA